MPLTKVTNSMINGATVNVLDYGADPTGTNDSLAAFDLATAAGEQIVIPVGTYKLTGTWEIPRYKRVMGLGCADTGKDARPKLVPTSAVTGAVIDLEGTYNWLENIYVDGTATTGVIGLRVGNVPLANLCFVNSVECDNFTGSGGKGLQIINTVGTYFTNCRFIKNQENVDIGTLSTGGCPTTTVFNQCWFREATGTGVVIRTNFQITFNDCLWEANGQSGMTIDTSGSRVCVGVMINGGWCEGNWASSGTPSSEAHFTFAGTGGDCENIAINSTFFSGGPASVRAIKATGIYDLLVNSPITSTSGGASMIQTTSCTGWMQNWRNQGTSGWANSGGSMFCGQNNWTNLNAEWTDWTPTIAAFSGTYTSVTINFARYKLIGKTMFIELQFTGTTSTTPSGILVSLPNNATPKCLGLKTPAWVNNTGTPETGYIENGGGDGIYVRRQNAANFGTGANCGVSVSMTVEIQ